jgi:hypothetical protein
VKLNKHYVYIYYDPRKQPPEPIYVGKGYGKRYLHHLTKAENKHLANKLKKITDANQQPIVEFVEENISNEAALILEVKLIAKYGRADKNLGTLCNWTDGGEGTCGYKYSDKTKRLFSEQRKDKKQTVKQYEANCNRKQSQEARLKISKVTQGHKRHTPEQLAAIKKHNTTRVISHQLREKWSNIRLGYTSTKCNYPSIENLIKMIEKSSVNAVAKELGITFASLSKYLKRRSIKVKDARFRQKDFERIS